MWAVPYFGRRRVEAWGKRILAFDQPVRALIRCIWGVLDVHLQSGNMSKPSREA